MRIRYASNNSGGVWWLTDWHWLALEGKGWVVNWAERLTDYGVFQWRDKVMMESDGTDCPVSEKKEVEG